MNDEPIRNSTNAPFVGADFPDDAYAKICELLQARRAFDIGSYKDRCVKRRMAGRVRARSCRDAYSYLELLRRDEDELDTLLSTLTIHVSHFFRNPSTYRVLEATVLPELLAKARQRPDKTLRLWSAGCSSGEEPYSLALLLQELAATDVRVEITATDVSPSILALAESGEYDVQRLGEIPDQVREAYFVRQEGTRFRLRDDIRRQVRFLRQNLLVAAPYAEADLVLCRNVMIYFSREEQAQILRRFAAVLQPDGYLVLGRAETLTGNERNLFRSVYPVERIYRSQAAPTDEPVTP